MKIILLLGVLLGQSLLWAQAEPEIQWQSDYEVATQLAAKQNRRLMVLFTNSKSCAPCILFKRNVIHTKEFADYAGKNLVLLMVDYGPCYLEQGKKELKEIEGNAKVPKELWMKGRGPWPYLFILSPKKEIIHSGRATDAQGKGVNDFITFLGQLKSP